MGVDGEHGMEQRVSPAGEDVVVYNGDEREATNEQSCSGRDEEVQFLAGEQRQRG